MKGMVFQESSFTRLIEFAVRGYASPAGDGDVEQEENTMILEPLGISKGCVRRSLKVNKFVLLVEIPGMSARFS